MFRITHFLIIAFLLAFCPRPLAAEDITRLGGDLTSNLPVTVALELPAPNIGSDALFQAHLDSHSDFFRSFEGERVNGKLILGPTFNHSACGSCHIHDGRGPAKINHSPPGSPMLVKVSLKGLSATGAPRDVPGIGEQLQNHLLSGKTRFKIRLKFREIKGKYPDGTPYKLRKPELNFSIPKVAPRKVVTSLRVAPSTIGMGLLDSVADETILAMSDPNDANGDGISGKVNMVPNLSSGALDIGRFGLRASHPTLEQQNAAAFFHDMGMTNRLFNPLGGDVEVSDQLLQSVTFYNQLTGVTPARDQNDPDVAAGKGLFESLNCSGCHKMTLQTDPDAVTPQLAGQEFHPFTDLLLHDMGPGLADKRAEFSANGSEWRTPPLWGLGLHDVLSDEAPGFLHDGRARTFEEAIIWHGGEAQAARDGFRNLPKPQRDQLVKFLRSL